ncbi:MAG: sulfatase [Candidatus Tritonobacter lacicola]|nr:sulfatase [Candidatus Tritonobacter lacicola]
MRVTKSGILAYGIVLAALIVAATLFCYLTTERLTPQRLNVILIVVDTLRADHLETYGYSRNTAKNIAKLAEDGILFKNAIAPASWTRPSIASIMTSMYPSSHGAVGRMGELDDKYLTIQEILKEHGYATVGFNSNGNAGKFWNFDQGFDFFNHAPMTRGYKGEKLQSPASSITDRGKAWVYDNPTERPFFLYLLYIDPHAPYFTDEEFQFNKSYKGKNNGSLEQLKEIDWNRRLSEDGQEIPGIMEECNYVKDLYDAEIAYTDKHIGRLMGFLHEFNLYENTLIILTADHGEGLWDHDNRGHGEDIYQEQLHIPLIIRCPGIKGGKRISNYVSTIDILPTVLDIVGIRPPAHFQGVSLLPMMLGKRAKEGVLLVEEQLDERDFTGVIKDGWKLIYDRAHDSYELYDLRKDRKEKQNLANSNDHSIEKIFRNLSLILHKKTEENKEIRNRMKPSEPAQEREIPEELKEKLRALGYI